MDINAQGPIAKLRGMSPIALRRKTLCDAPRLCSWLVCLSSNCGKCCAVWRPGRLDIEGLTWTPVTGIYSWILSRFMCTGPRVCLRGAAAI